MMELDKYPIVDIGRSRIGHQYNDSHKFKEFIELTINPLTELQDVFFNLLDIDLNKAKGIKLDLIGRIIGAPALIYNAVPQPFFGFADQDEGLEFGELDDPDAGGFFREIGQLSNIDYIFDNDEYKKVVTAQIIKNNSDCTPDEIIQIVQLLIDDDFAYYEVEMGIVIAPSEPIGRRKRRLLEEMLPIPAGVGLGILDGKYDNPEFDEQDKLEIYNDEY